MLSNRGRTLGLRAPAHRVEHSIAAAPNSMAALDPDAALATRCRRRGSATPPDQMGAPLEAPCAIAAGGGSELDRRVPDPQVGGARTTWARSETLPSSGAHCNRVVHRRARRVCHVPKLRAVDARRSRWISKDSLDPVVSCLGGFPVLVADPIAVEASGAFRARRVGQIRGRQRSLRTLTPSWPYYSGDERAMPHYRIPARVGGGL